jgi:hypothetical protein
MRAELLGTQHHHINREKITRIKKLKKKLKKKITRINFRKEDHFHTFLPAVFYWSR